MLGLKVVFINRISLHKSWHKICISIWWKNNRLLCCVSVRDFESKVKLIKGINLTHLKRKCSIESWLFVLWRKVYILWIQKSKKSICHRTTFYSIFNMSSCRKPEIHNDLPKIIKIKWICYEKKQWSKFLNCVYFILF